MTPREPSAPAHIDATLATSAAGVRIGALLVLLGALPALSRAPYESRAAWLAPVLVLETGAFVALCLRLRRVYPLWAVLDQVLIAAALAGTAGPGRDGRLPQSPLFTFALVSVVAVGLPRWPWWASAAGALPGAAGTVLPRLLSPDLARSGWALLPDGSALPTAALPAAALIAWLVAALVRRAAGEYGRDRALTIRRAALLAEERERVRQGMVLQHQLLSTLDEVVAAGAVAEPALAHQLGAEVRWLRRVTRTGVADPPPVLDAGLRPLAGGRGADRILQTLETLTRTRAISDPELHGRLAAQAAWLRRFVETGTVDQSDDLPAGLAAAARAVAAGGIAVELNDAALRTGDPPRLTGPARAALVQATHGTLAGLAAGASSAVVRVERDRGGVLVTILARGPQAGPTGADLDPVRSRLAEVGGRFTAGPSPYAELWVPGDGDPDRTAGPDGAEGQVGIDGPDGGGGLVR